jgi:flagellar protein FliO/FliZ
MQFLTNLFGISDTALIIAAVLIAAIVVIAIGAWVLTAMRRPTVRTGRSRNRRLAITDSLPVDQKRHLLIVRRDDVEHLVLIGGAQDMVIETGIPAPLSPARVSLRSAAPVLTSTSNTPANAE